VNLVATIKRYLSSWPVSLLGVFVLAIAIYIPSLMGERVWDDDDLLSGVAFGGGQSLIGSFNPSVPWALFSTADVRFLLSR